jgi:prephenate dehydrogenase
MRVGRAVLSVAWAALLAGCAVMTEDGERLSLRSPQFRSYVERIFREQNKVADRFAFALEDATDAPAAVTAAEQSLQDACARLNELATARRDERRQSVHERLEAARSVPGCERTLRSSTATLDAWRKPKP